MTAPGFSAWERRAAAAGFRRVAGVDEVGRGPLAGPVVAAAVILPNRFSVAGVTDSKRLSAARRRRLCGAIYAQARSVGIGIVDPVQIDRTNILQAALLAMCMAVDNLLPAPDYLLIDGTFPVDSDLPQEAVVKGDRHCLCISAASIVAKETRDRLMERYHLEYPHYGFDAHKGYPTVRHKAAIARHGCCPIHRRSFRGVREHLPPDRRIGP